MRPLFKLSHGQILKSGLVPLVSMAPTKRPEQKYLPSDQDWNGLERGHYSSLTRINGVGQNAATIGVIPWTIIEVRPAALSQMLHVPENHKWDT